MSEELVRMCNLCRGIDDVKRLVLAVDNLPSEGDRYVIASADMCPRHRKRAIAPFEKGRRNPGGKPRPAPAPPPAPPNETTTKGDPPKGAATAHDKANDDFKDM